MIKRTAVRLAPRDGLWGSGSNRTESGVHQQSAHQDSMTATNGLPLLPQHRPSEERFKNWFVAKSCHAARGSLGVVGPNAKVAGSFKLSEVRRQDNIFPFGSWGPATRLHDEAAVDTSLNTNIMRLDLRWR